jgi:SAM-dependent methyltransferase
MAKRLDAALYPLAWEDSYDANGAQWRGTPNYSKMLGELDLSGTMLELGVGNGNTASHILKVAPRGASLHCIDIARGALGSLPPALRADARVRILQSDVRSLPLKDCVFSAVIGVHILTHMLHGDEARTLLEIRRVLRKGGRAMVEAFAPGDMRFGTGEEIEQKTFLRADGTITRFYDEKDLRDVIEGAGMAILRLETASREVRHEGKKYRRQSIVAIAEKPL